MPPHSEVVLELPAVDRSASVVRTTVAAVAMTCDASLDEITDIRLAVDEACSVLLPLAVAGTTMRCTVEVRHDDLRVTVHVTSATDHLEVTETIDLRILGALATYVHTGAAPLEDGMFCLTVHLLLACSTS